VRVDEAFTERREYMAPIALETGDPSMTGVYPQGRVLDLRYNYSEERMKELNKTAIRFQPEDFFKYVIREYYALSLSIWQFRLGTLTLKKWTEEKDIVDFFNYTMHVAGISEQSIRIAAKKVWEIAKIPPSPKDHDLLSKTAVPLSVSLEALKYARHFLKDGVPSEKRLTSVRREITTKVFRATYLKGREPEDSPTFIVPLYRGT